MKPLKTQGFQGFKLAEMSIYNLQLLSSKAKSKPSEADSIWKGRARGRADDVICHGHKKSRSKANFAPTWYEWRYRTFQKIP